MARNDGRAPDQLRPVELAPGYLELQPASCLAKMGRTWVLCTAIVEEKVPPFLEGKRQGWVTAEYSMLPGSTQVRSPRSKQAGGRSQEISRLIGRCLRASIDMKKLGIRTITVDCDVVQADGGTRTASVTGGFVAMGLALGVLRNKGLLLGDPVTSPVAAVSAGLVGSTAMLDLDYSEDSTAEADLNVAMNGAGELVEVQGTAEGRPFGEPALQELLGLARKGIGELLAAQRAALGEE